MASSCIDLVETELQRQLKDVHETRSSTVVPCAGYSYHAPRPPTIDINVPRGKTVGPAMELEPSYQGVDPWQLTREDLQIITQNSKQLAFDATADWAHGDRYAAQAVLDYLYLGPTSVIRDHAFLTCQAITMMVVVRDARMAGTLRSVDHASRELGIPVEYVRVGGGFSDLIQALPNIIGLINQHLLAVHDAQSTPGGTRTDAQGQEGNDAMGTETRRPQRGKVLITCDSGNHHSATIVAAYLMSVYGQDMVSASQFVLLQRFSCVFEDDAKLMLRSWEEIVRARSMTAHHVQSENGGQSLRRDARTEDGGTAARGGRTVLATPTRKRGFDDMMHSGLSAREEAGAADEARFADRDAFVPFADVSEMLA
ncbi:hypothetical protein E4U53_000556 [Claviceps sorghi]|nr:hypothetical protein E4U53_000556 [Claviceps sorghi]